MKKVVIVTDTTACIPQERVATLDIEVVPVSLIFEERVYRDEIDITPTEFYTLLRKANKLPTTSSSSPEPYFEAYRKVSQRAKDILCITEPAKFSAMFKSALIAKEMARSEFPDLTIEVVEGTTAAAGQGLVAMAAARAAASGKTLEEIMEIVKSIMPRVHLYAMLDTLHYLVKGGRVPQAAALVNSLLKIKPIFTLNQGDPHTISLPRTTKSAIKQLLKLMEQKIVRGQALRVAVMHADAPDEAAELRERIASQFDCTELFVTEFTPVMGVHTGPGLIGVSFYSGD